MDQNETSTMASKSPSRHWKTVFWKASGQLKTLQKKEADLPKVFSRRLTEREGYLTQNKAMTLKGVYQFFFETYDKLEANKNQQRLLFKPKYLEAFDNDTKRVLEGKSKVLRWAVDEVPFLRDIEKFHTKYVGFCEDTFRAYKTVKPAHSIESELSSLEEKLTTENLSDSEKQTLCNQVERLVEKLDDIYAESIHTIKLEYRSREFVDFSNIRSHYRDLIKQYGQRKDCGNQTSLVSSTSACDRDPNKTVIDTRNEAVENAEENVEVSSRHSATQGSRKQPSIAISRSSRWRQIDEMELENLRAKNGTEQRLQERQLELEQEPGGNGTSKTKERKLKPTKSENA